MDGELIGNGSKALTLTHGNALTQEVIAVVQGAIHAASQDYFGWSHGQCLFECAEFIPQVYAAKRLSNSFRQNVIVRLEHPVDELVPSKMAGRVDLTVEFNTGAFYAIAFGRYASDLYTNSDRACLQEIVDFRRGRVGLLVMPWYTRDESDDLPLQARDRHTDHPSQIWHLSGPKPLPDCFAQVDGFTHEWVLVVEIREPAF